MEYQHPQLTPEQRRSLPWRGSGEGATSVRLAVIGDAHGAFSTAEDGAALQWLRPHMTIVVGDIDNENLELVQEVAQLQHPPKAVILGNHDAWSTGRSVKGKAFKPAERLSLGDLLRTGRKAAELAAQHPTVEAALQRLPSGAANGVVRQLEELGAAHVGYAGLQVPGKRVSIVGARPFSHGGDKFSGATPLLSTFWPGVDSFQASAERIQRAAEVEARDRGSEAVVLIAHNAPLGLGSMNYDLAGVDWKAGAGDHGDLDLRLALYALHQQHQQQAGGAPGASARVPLVLCGHMHHRVKDGTYRRMAHVDPDTGCVTLNAAVVPRVRRAPPPDPSSSSSSPTSPPPPGTHTTLRHFLLVELEDGEVRYAQHAWVRVAVSPQAQHAQHAAAAAGGRFGEAEGYECSLYSLAGLVDAQCGAAGRNVRVFDSHFQKWHEVFVPAVAPRVAMQH